MNNFYKGISQQTITEVKIMIEHMDNVLGETDRLTLLQEEEEEDQTLVNFEVSLWCNPTQLHTLDQIAANPVLFTITEGNPKSAKDAKKAPKEGSSQILGRCNWDLLPLLLGELQVHEVLLVEQDKTAVGQQIVSWPNLPQLSVSACIEEALLTPEQIDDMNILYVTLGSMYNALSMMTDTMQFSAATVFPFQNEELEEIRFDAGFLTSQIDEDKTKRWVGLSSLPGRSGYSMYKISEDTPKCNLPIHLDAKLNEKIPRVEWNALRRCLISKRAGDAIYDILSKYQCWPLEIMVSPQQTQRSSGKSKGKDAVSQSMHLIAYLDFTKLLYPGETKVQSAAQVFTFNQEDLATKFGLQKTLYENLPFESARKESSTSSKQKRSDTKSSVKVPSQPVTVPDAESTPLITEQGEPVFVIMEVELFKPLVMKRTIAQLEKKISEAIPPRPELPKSVMAAELAGKHYTRCIQIMSDVISREYQKFIQQRNTTGSYSNLYDDVHRDFEFFLYNSGVYQELKEMLKNKVSLLIREKCNEGKEFINRKEMQNYVSEVYIYLVEEMHLVVNSFLGNGAKPITEPFVLTYNQLSMFSMEADNEEKFEQANLLLLEIISRDNKNPDYWLEYGVFCLEHGQLEKAKECLKEILSIDIRHKLGMLMYAILLTQNEEYELAEIFFEALTYFYPRLAEAWIVFHLFYLKIENYPGADVALTMGQKCFEQKKDIIPLVNIKSLCWCTTLYSNDSLFLITAIMLLRLNSYEFAEMALAQELIHNSCSVPYLYYLAVNHYLEKRYDDAISHISTAVREHGKDYCLWSLMGHCYHKLRNKEKAKECYQHIVDSYDRPADIHLVELRLGEYYLEENKYEIAKNIFLDACTHSPSPTTWLRVGITCYMMNEFREAEQALKEANMLDNTSPHIWGYLTLVNLQFQRHAEFEQCYRQTLRHNLEDKEILDQIKALQRKLEYPDPVPLIVN